MPHDLRDRLTLALAPFRNREAAFTLAAFIARFWSVPGRVAGSFPIDRRALADHQELELTEARVRGAIQTLEAVGFLERAIPPSGSRYKATEGGLHRKPILFVFGADFAPAFIAANRRGKAARGALSGARRPITPSTNSRPSVGHSEAQALKSPKIRIQAEPLVIMGEITRPAAPPPQTLSLLPRLSDAALKVFGRPSLGKGGAK